MDRSTELYLAAMALERAYIRLHPELAIVQNPIRGTGKAGWYKDDGQGRFEVGDTTRNHIVVKLDLSPWVAQPSTDD